MPEHLGPRKTAITPQLICPEISSINKQQLQRLTSFYDEILDFAKIPANPISVVGLELRASLIALEGADILPRADNEFWEAKCRSLFLRPAIEPILCSYWSHFSDFSLTGNTAFNIASALAGKKISYRSGPSFGRSVKGDVEFEPLNIAGQWLEKIHTAAHDSTLAYMLPAYVYAQVIMTHPFSDGNGRFARAMVHAALAKSFGIRLPSIALAPTFYRRAESLGASMIALSNDHDWGAFTGVFIDVLGDAYILTKRLLNTNLQPH